MALSPGVAAWLVAQGHDAVHAAALHLDRAPDREILARAAAEDRIVVTADLDFPRLLAMASADRPGLILLRGAFSESRAIERLARTLAVVPTADLSTCLVVIEPWRIRRRRLPIA